jgi:hypothetical protein
VQLLLIGQAAVNAADEEGETALHKASLQGHTSVLPLLLVAKAAVDAADQYWDTALHKAASSGMAASVKLLLSGRASVNAVDEAGQTALHTAAYNGHSAVVEQLLGAHASTDAVNAFGQTPLHVAASRGKERVLQLLLNAGANVNAAAPRDQPGYPEGFFMQTPLLSAAERGHIEIVTLLLGVPELSTGVMASAVAAAAEVGVSSRWEEAAFIVIKELKKRGAEAAAACIRHSMQAAAKSVFRQQGWDRVAAKMLKQWQEDEDTVKELKES